MHTNRKEVNGKRRGKKKKLKIPTNTAARQARVIAVFSARATSLAAKTSLLTRSCHASALHSKLRDLPVPVGDSMRAFCFFCSEAITSQQGNERFKSLKDFSVLRSCERVC